MLRPSLVLEWNHLNSTATELSRARTLPKSYLVHEALELHISIMAKWSKNQFWTKKDTTGTVIDGFHSGQAETHESTLAERWFRASDGAKSTTATPSSHHPNLRITLGFLILGFALSYSQYSLALVILSLDRRPTVWILLLPKLRGGSARCCPMQTCLPRSYHKWPHMPTHSWIYAAQCRIFNTTEYWLHRALSQYVTWR